MRFLAAWFGNPEEYWLNILILIAMVAAGVWALRRIRSRTKN